ncbi:CotH kinase family protein [Novipirellula artificiosorum]|uniref:Inner spore coat protein H n=1 Tax=Novipirellula artificiosorum TaxID=2528016 RepID=A0A5C6D7Z6_9BACT|nr:CotH kinase family protein [Novipirellula artificiosorum]TWU32195.1 Inner spore coat protein H [Novipirellula artificiosorum]
MKKKLLSLLIVGVAAAGVGIVFAKRPVLFGFGGPGGPDRTERKILEQYDADASGWLDANERQMARKAIASDQGRRGGPGGGTGGPGHGESTLPGTPGPKVAVGDVNAYPDKPLYDTSILRTVFLQFDNVDWESEMEDFYSTDVDVPATMIMDGKTYEMVGVHFRGASSYDHVPRGGKRSVNVSLDMIDEDQNIDGYKTLNLLNCHCDPSMMSSVVYSHIARQYIPAPKANFVHLVVNGESWGLYNNVQQFDKKFLKENYGGSKGTRWKVSGSPQADGGLRYLGDDLDPYKLRFEMKSSDGKKAWSALVQLCKTLNETPSEELESALEPMLDIDETLKFLALDIVLANNDGYWTRASDYNLFRDHEGIFHVLPHDMNEAFALSGPGPDSRRGPDDRPHGPGGPGGKPGFIRDFFGSLVGGHGGGPLRGEVDVDPLVDINSDRMPLRSRLLGVPELQQRYLQYVQQIASESVVWENLGPVVEDYRQLIEPLVKADTRKLTSYEAFQAATDPETPSSDHSMSLRRFADERPAFLNSTISAADKAENK